MLALAALAWSIAAVAMTALWAWQRRARHAGITRALWPAVVGTLAVMYANLGDGAWMRRSAIAWMIGSWGARLAVQGVYTRAAGGPAEADGGRPFWFFQALAAAAVVASSPALLASLNRDPNFSAVELAACALWAVGFAGETTADRQRLRFTSNPATEGLLCRIGLWRYSRYADRVFEALIWIAYVIFGLTSMRTLLNV
jgi:steroid 5-alpha reductase family enzyme